MCVEGVGTRRFGGGDFPRRIAEAAVRYVLYNGENVAVRFGGGVCQESAFATSVQRPIFGFRALVWPTWNIFLGEVEVDGHILHRRVTPRNVFRRIVVVVAHFIQKRLATHVGTVGMYGSGTVALDCILVAITLVERPQQSTTVGAANTLVFLLQLATQ